MQVVQAQQAQQAEQAQCQLDNVAPLEPHAPQLENQAPCQTAVEVVLVEVVVAVVTTAEVVIAVVVAVVPTVVQAVVAKTRHHVQGRHFNFLQSFLSTLGFEISFLTQI